MFAVVEQWGNSLAIRLTNEEFERLGISEGDRVRVKVEKLPTSGTVDLSDLPTFEDPDPRASRRHDEILYGPGGEEAE